MTKNQLIRMLSRIEGNPEVTIYNRLVQDTQPLSHMEHITVYKRSKSGIQHGIVLDRIADLPDEATVEQLEDARAEHPEDAAIVEAIFKRCTFEPANPYFDEKAMKREYGESMETYTLVPGKANKTYQDRLGTIEY